MRNVIVSGHGENFSCFWLNSGNNGTKHWPHLWLSHQSWYYSWTDNWKENRSNQRASLRRISMLGGSLWSWYFKGKTRGEVSVRENSVCSTDSALPQIMLVCSTPSLSLLYSQTKYDSAIQKIESALHKIWEVEQNQGQNGSMNLLYSRAEAIYAWMEVWICSTVDQNQIQA